MVDSIKMVFWNETKFTMYKRRIAINGFFQCDQSKIGIQYRDNFVSHLKHFKIVTRRTIVEEIPEEFQGSSLLLHRESNLIVCWNSKRAISGADAEEKASLYCQTMILQPELLSLS
jgi:hypothetical protein